MSLLPEFSEFSPALTVFNRRLFVAWTGTDELSQVNIISADQVNPLNFSNKRILGENSIAGPALAVFQDRLYYAWTGTDPQHQLNIMSSADGIYFEYKHILGESSPTGPALAAFQDRLYYAWTDPQNRLHIMSSTNGLDFGDRHILEERSVYRPALLFGRKPFIDEDQPRPDDHLQQLLLAWTGLDGRLNILAARDGMNFSYKRTFDEWSNGEPALGIDDFNIYLAWTGTDGNHSLNHLDSHTAYPDFDTKSTLYAGSRAAPAVADTNSDTTNYGDFYQTFAAWIDPFQLHVAILASLPGISVNEP